METQNSQTHQMVLEKTHDSGEEEWYCPTCGRRFLFTWPPNYKRVVLDPGDEYAVHSGGKGGVGMSPPEVVQQKVVPPVEDENLEIFPVEDESLAIYADWMEKVDFDNLWNT